MPTILVVDDDAHIRQVITFALAKAGFRTIEAADGQQALERFAREAPDLVVLDVVMPELDGTESAGGCGAARTCRSSFSPRRTRRSTVSSGSSSAATTTWRSPSARASWWPACARSCGARRASPARARTARASSATGA